MSTHSKGQEKLQTLVRAGKAEKYKHKFYNTLTAAERADVDLLHARHVVQGTEKTPETPVTPSPAGEDMGAHTDAEKLKEEEDRSKWQNTAPPKPLTKKERKAQEKAAREEELRSRKALDEAESAENPDAESDEDAETATGTEGESGV